MSDAPQGFPGCENWGNEELYVCLAPGSSLPTLTRAPFLGRALLELVEQVQPTAAQLSQWCALRRTLEQFLQREFGAGTRLRFFGSVVAGLARADSDLDLCLAVEPGRGALDLTGSEVPTVEVVLATLGRVLAVLRPMKLPMVLVANARVPIVKHHSGKPPLFDITLNAEGVRNSAFLRAYVRSSPTELYPMAMVIVLWAKSAGFHDSSRGGINTYTLLLMSIYYLLHCQRIAFVDPASYAPQISELEADPRSLSFSADSCVGATVASLVAGFFQFYCKSSRSAKYVISITLESRIADGYRLTKQEKGWETKYGEGALAVEDPFETHLNTARQLNAERWKAMRAAMGAALAMMVAGEPVSTWVNARMKKGASQRTKAAGDACSKCTFEIVTGEFAQFIRLTEHPTPRYYRITPAHPEDDSDDDQEDDEDGAHGVRTLDLDQWLNPKRVSPITLPTRTTNRAKYLSIVANNILAEYSRMFQEVVAHDCSPDDPNCFQARVVDEYTVECDNNRFTMEGLVYWLVAMVTTDDRGTHCSLHLVRKQCPDPQEFEAQARVMSASSQHRGGAGQPRAQMIPGAVFSAGCVIVPCVVSIHFSPPLPVSSLGAIEKGEVRLHPLDYIGGFAKEFLAAQNLLGQLHTAPSEAPQMLGLITDPCVSLRGEYLHGSIPRGALNYAQARVLEHLSQALEGVQGPPGTGKTRLIQYLIDNVIPPNVHVLVTCQSNAAVEADCMELGEREDMIVVGKKTKIARCLRFCLDEVVARQPEIRRLQRKMRNLEVLQNFVGERVSCAIRRLTGHLRHQIVELKESIRSAEARRKATGLQPGVQLQADLRRKTSLEATLRWRKAFALLRSARWLCLRRFLARYPPIIEEEMRALRPFLRHRVLESARVFLCTVHSISNLRRQYQKYVEQPLSLHTVFIDEAGCVTETSVPLLMLCEPRNVVVIGDHKQLPPFTNFQQNELRGPAAHYNRSLLERIAHARQSLPMITTQYRMHPEICEVVDKLFYKSQLITDAGTVQARGEPVAIWWVNADKAAECPVRSSFRNDLEVEAVRSTCEWLLKSRPDFKILVLTFYEAQLRALVDGLWGDETRPDLRRVRVHTVDGAQGQQEDVVVLSCVRTDSKIGFTGNSNRMCVALSRARQMLVVVGHAPTFALDHRWNVVLESSCLVQFHPGLPVKLEVGCPDFRDSALKRFATECASASGGVQRRRYKLAVERLKQQLHPAMTVIQPYGCGCDENEQNSAMENLPLWLPNLLSHLVEFERQQQEMKEQRRRELGDLFGTGAAPPACSAPIRVNAEQAAVAALEEDFM
eukprot:RCo024580